MAFGKKRKKDDKVQVPETAKRDAFDDEAAESGPGSEIPEEVSEPVEPAETPQELKKTPGDAPLEDGSYIVVPAYAQRTEDRGVYGVVWSGGKELARMPLKRLNRISDVYAWAEARRGDGTVEPVVNQEALGRGFMYKVTMPLAEVMGG